MKQFVLPEHTGRLNTKRLKALWTKSRQAAVAMCSLGGQTDRGVRTESNKTRDKRKKERWRHAKLTVGEEKIETDKHIEGHQMCRSHREKDQTSRKWRKKTLCAWWTLSLSGLKRS